MPHHFHHLINKNCNNPNISRRPNNISAVKINFTIAGKSP